MTQVVLLHALSLDASMWEAQRRELTALGHQVLAVDQRGFGSAPLGDAPPSLDVVADDLARELDARGVERAVFAGSSMGGYVLMTFLRRYPGRAEAVCLLSARATADPPEAQEQRLRFADAITADGMRETVVARTTPRLVGRTTRETRPEVLARVLADAHRADPAAVAWAQRAIAERSDHTATLRETDVSALVIAGAEDELVAADESLHTVRALPRGELVTIEGAGHLQPLETPDAVTAALCSLLDRVGAATC
ncbi:alpha/beta fold hydrolase [Streptomyces aurantiogriseus]|uniref:Alpha/beta hydrolase n=1 Tax=Streptomyces aurantiogriseus TaxID=66870 RepID=A0A918F599_9ACTN|nr:alpha/beta hydrolase [Streptomyces aurantiogriseus]GGR02585.1 alpha/beta hydrolase [Streptomyces aurantiogriseus]